METEMLIDAHNHVYWFDHDPDKFVENMDEHGIDVTWLLSWELAEGMYDHNYDTTFMPPYIGMPIDSIWDAVDKHPDRFVAGFAPNPKMPHAVQRLRSAHRNGARVAGEFKFRCMFDDPDAIDVYRVAGELGMPVILHLDSPWLPPSKDADGVPTTKWWYGGTIANLENALRLCPDTVFLGHAPGFWREVSGDADDSPDAYPEGPVIDGGRMRPLFDKYPNLWGDLSAGSALRAISRDREWGRRFLIDYHKRLLFARDYFDSALMEYLVTLDLPDDVVSSINSENALRLVPLGE
jgi:predicted TIM-barrel fold metal-dependent hydrolase